LLNIESAVKDEATYTISDMSGKQLLKKHISLSAGNNAFEITEARYFAKAVYMLNITASQQKQTIKIIKGN
jgi:hypothetical protein